MLIVSLAGLGLGFTSNVTLDDRIVLLLLLNLFLSPFISFLSFSRAWVVA